MADVGESATDSISNDVNSDQLKQSDPCPPKNSTRMSSHDVPGRRHCQRQCRPAGRRARVVAKNVPTTRGALRRFVVLWYRLRVARMDVVGESNKVPKGAAPDDSQAHTHK